VLSLPIEDNFENVTGLIKNTKSGTKRVVRSVVDNRDGPVEAMKKTKDSVNMQTAKNSEMQLQSDWNSQAPLQNFEKHDTRDEKRKSGFNIAVLVQNGRKKLKTKIMKRMKRNPWKFEFKGYWSDGSSSYSDESKSVSESESKSESNSESKSCSSESRDYSSYEADFKEGKGKGANNWIGKDAESDYSQEDISTSHVQEHFLTDKGKPIKLTGLNDPIVKSNVTVYSSSVRMKMSQTTTLKNSTNILYLVLPSKYSVSDNSLVAITGNNTIVITQNMNTAPTETSKNQTNLLKSTALQNSNSTKMKGVNNHGNFSKNKTESFSLNLHKEIYKRKKRQTSETTKAVAVGTSFSVEKRISDMPSEDYSVLEEVKTDDVEDAHLKAHPLPWKKKSERVGYEDSWMPSTKGAGLGRNSSRSGDYLEDGQWTEFFDVINF